MREYTPSLTERSWDNTDVWQTFHGYYCQSQAGKVLAVETYTGQVLSMSTRLTIS
jgi:hypothetical protein